MQIAAPPRSTGPARLPGGPAPSHESLAGTGKWWGRTARRCLAARVDGELLAAICCERLPMPLTEVNGHSDGEWSGSESVAREVHSCHIA